MIQLLAVNDSNYCFAKNVYLESFPVDERRNFDTALQLTKTHPVTFKVIYYQNTAVGIVVLWCFSTFSYLEHFAIAPNIKGQGLGSKALSYLLSNLKHKLVLEVEHPTTIEATKRIQFYTKFSFQLNHFNYIQPPYTPKQNEVALYIMSWGGLLTENEYELVKHTLYTQVYNIQNIK